MGERRGMKGLELWCKKVTEGYPGVKIDNMTTSWRDGLAFCAMIHHFRPELIDFDKLNKEDVYHNNELAFRVAEHHLGIPALLEAEDMVEFEVPDRLSILTYLSQFYQTFEVARGKSSPRVAAKRPTSTQDHGIVSPASTSPPTKVPTPAAGRVRREPCAKCKLPVFIAERLHIGKLLYHRTCFKCARCNSQLTLANYYVTEKGDFCCEVCPDEETKDEENSVLQRSLSDEEKSASLRKVSDIPDAYSTEFESVLEFPSDTELKKNFTLTQSDSKVRLTFFQSQLEDKDKMNDPTSSTESENDDLPPDLPNTKPPALIDVEVNINSKSKNDNYSSFSDKSPSQDNVNNNVKLDKDKNFVTKDLVSPNSVKARLRLFEGLDSKKSDEVHLVRSRNSPEKNAKVVNLSDLEDFDNISKKEVDSDGVSINSEGKSNKEPVKRFSSSKHIELKFNDNPEKETVKSPLEILESTTENSVITIESSDSGHISLDTDAFVVEILDSTQESVNSEGSDLVKVNVEPPSPIVTISDDSYLSAKGDASKFENTVATQAFTTAREALASTEMTETSFKSIAEGSVVEPKSSSVVADVSSSDENKLESDLYAAKPKEVQNTVQELHETSEYRSEEKVIEPKTDITTEDHVEKVSDDSEKPTKTDLHTPNNSQVAHKSEDPKYPDDMNPFGDEEEEVEPPKSSLNPFGEDTDEEEEVTKTQMPTAVTRKKKIVMPREDIYGTPECLKSIYIQRISVNPFEDESDSEETKKEVVKSVQKPMPSPRQRRKIIPIERPSLNPFGSDEEEEVEMRIVPVAKPRQVRSSSNAASTLAPSYQNSALSPSSKGSHGGSTSSISSGSAFGSARKKKPAPRPPLPSFSPGGGTGFRGSASPSLTSLPSCCSADQSVSRSPVSIRSSHGKTKRAPPPPPNASTPVVTNQDRLLPNDRLAFDNVISPINFEEKDGHKDEGKPEERSFDSLPHFNEKVEREKCIKDEENRNRQSLDNTSYKLDTTEIDRIINNKSTHGKWKRQKGKAPSRPIPQRRIIKSLPMSEIRRELDMIEKQQQGLEKQGVRLEQIIREKCEGGEGDEASPDDNLPIDVEDLILQLFELVNEKNELFRRQAELMYLRRQQRLEEEHADVEYQIRCLMLQPEANKTDSDKAREEALINRLVEIVERRNEIIECLEMDRIRETEEDDSISNQLTLYSLKREGDKEPIETDKKHKKDKLKLKKIKHVLHLHKHKEKGRKAELDKDIDTAEVKTDTLEKKKKKFGLF